TFKVPAGTWNVPLSATVTPNARFGYFFTLTWKPAALRVLTTSSASKSPVTSKVSLRALAVLPVTPFTLPRASLIPWLHALQQLWMPVSVSDLTLPLVTPLSSLIVTSLLSIVPVNPPSARASIAFCADSLSLAVIEIVLDPRSHLPVTPSTFWRIWPTTWTQ